ncbi:MAG: 3-deoxy-manno-octulosonate cytidylyltransferase [Mariprofundales bacterium]|nr:3-deoxy-manno-octulosonate cytidylyltransferase [Mariprofundales bacterium]
MKVIIGIPARYQSSRLPGKALAPLAGKPMITHVVARAHEAALGEVLVATDDPRIAEAAAAAGATARLTTQNHRSGTERLTEALDNDPCDVVVNLQGDEPLIDPAAIRAVVQPFVTEPTLAMATLARPARHDEIDNPNVVKVVCNAKGHALYFSRATIPYPHHNRNTTPIWAHVGLYAYRKPFLMLYPTLSPCDSETSESLEQLRVLHHGYSIAVVQGEYRAFGVDTPEDLAQAEKLLMQREREREGAALTALGPV